MEHNFPCPIISDKDLSIYEDFLNSDDYDIESESYNTSVHGMQIGIQKPQDYKMKIEKRKSCCLIPDDSQMPESLSNSSFFPGYLRNHIGKLVKVESLIANCLECRIGTLVQVGADYIVIKLYQSCSTMVCDGPSIKYITIIHDNDMSKAGLF